MVVFIVVVIDVVVIVAVVIVVVMVVVVINLLFVGPCFDLLTFCCWLFLLTTAKHIFVVSVPSGVEIHSY